MNEKIINLTNCSLNFPKLPTNALDKSNYIESIVNFLSDDNKIVFVNGKQGVGKTHLLANFCKKYNQSSISIFVNTRDKSTYDQRIIEFDLSNQVHCLLNNHELEENFFFTGYLKTTHIELKRLIKKNNQNIYFIFDGLENIPEKDLAQINEIISLLPFTSPNIYFLFSGEEKSLKSKINCLTTIPSMDFYLPPFSLDETKIYLKLINPDLVDFSENIYSLTKGIGYKLHQIRRLINFGKSISEIIGGCKEMDDLFSLEWSQVKDDDVILIRLLAFIAYGDRKYSIDLLSDLTEYDPEQILAKLNNISFINISESTHIEFCHDLHKNYAKKKLKKNEPFVHERLLEYYLNNPENYDSIISLTSLFENKNKWNEIIELLTPNSYNVLLDKSKSLKSVILLTEKGILASNKTDRAEDYFKFNLYKSVFLEFEQLDIWKSEIEAKTDLGEYNEALSLAQSAFMVEDRLKMLSLIARKMKENNQSVETNLIEKIREIYSEVSFEGLKEVVIEIATNLMYSCPDLAIDLVEKSSQVSGGNMIDWALAQLSISMFKSEFKSNKENVREDIKDEINSRIKNNHLKNLVKGINYFGKNNSVNDILNLIKTVDKASEKLFFIRNWIIINKQQSGLELLIEESFDIIVKSTEYVANASLMKDLAFGLNGIMNEESITNLIIKFDIFKETIKHRGPSRDYVIYNLLLAESEISINYDKSLNRLLEIFYYYIYEIVDLSTKTDCLAVFIRKTIFLQKSYPNLKSEKIVEEALEYLVENVDILLKNCAFHYDIFKNIIKSLAKIDSEHTKIAFGICKRMNLKINREFAFHDLLFGYLENDNNDYSDDLFLDIYNSIDNSENKKTVIIELMDKFAREPIIKVSSIIVKKIYEEIATLNDSVIKCYCYVRAFILYEKKTIDDIDYMSNSEELIFRSWENIDSAWDRIEVAFKISSGLAKYNKTLAKEYLNRGSLEKNKTYLDSPKRANILVSTIKLAIHAFVALKTHIQNVDYLKVKDIINNIPSLSTRLILWGDLALRIKKVGNESLSKEIVKTEIRSNFELFSKLDQSTRNNVMLQISPILFYYHKETAFLDIQSFVEFSNQEDVYLSIINYITTKCTYDDEHELSFTSTEMGFEDVLDCISVLECIKTDSIIYSTIKMIVDIITEKKDRYSSEQKADIKRRLGKIINSKLPDQINIQHDGYKIISQAQLLRIDKEKFDKWRPFFSDALNIPNDSDKTIVFTEILNALNLIRRTDYEVEKKSKVNQILKFIDTIPTFTERIQRLTDFLPTFKEVDREWCLRIISSTFDNILENKDSVNIPQQKEIIDFVFNVSPELAESLIAKYDTDLSRKRIGEPIKNHYNFLKLRKEIFETQDIKNDDINYSQMCYSLLKALNSNKLSSKPLKELDTFIGTISDHAFTTSYPVSLYVIENTVHRHQHTPAAESIIRRIYDATIFCIELVSYLGKKSVNHPINIYPQQSQENHEIIHKGEENKAIIFIKDWALKHEIKELIIIDQYFTADDLTLLKVFLEINYSINYTILTGLSQNCRLVNENELEQSFKDSWSKISIEKPPIVKIVLVGKEKDNEAPFHDRWWIVNRGSSGLRVGTSFNSLGKNKDCEISILTEDESKDILKKIAEPYAEKTIPHYVGDKLRYKIFFL